MRSTYAQWLKYAAYTLLITTVVVGGYYFVYVQQHAEQLANDRLAMLHESSGSFAEELGRVKRNLVNTLQDDAKTATPDTLASARRELSDIAHVHVQEWETGFTCHDLVDEEDEQHDHHAEVYVTFEPTVNHPHLSFELPRSHSHGTTSDQESTSCTLAGINLETPSTHQNSTMRMPSMHCVRRPKRPTAPSGSRISTRGLRTPTSQRKSGCCSIDSPSWAKTSRSIRTSIRCSICASTFGKEQPPDRS